MRELRREGGGRDWREEVEGGRKCREGREGREGGEGVRKGGREVGMKGREGGWWEGGR